MGRPRNLPDDGMRLAGIPVSPLLVGELALLLQEDGWLALSTKLSRAIVERTVAIPLTTGKA